MARRYASYRLRRPSGGGGGSGAAAGLLLPAAAVEFWHSEIACTAATWVGQIGGRTLNGQNTPVVAADGAFFNGRVVGQATQAATRSWFGTGLANMAPTGTRPWTFAIARFRDTGVAGTEAIASIGNSGSGNAQNGLGGTGATFIHQSFNPLANLASAVALDANPHVFKAWKDVTNKNIKVSGVTTSTAEPGTTTADCNAAGIGSFQAGGSVGDVSVAFFLVCSAQPTATEEANLDAWALSYWGVT